MSLTWWRSPERQFKMLQKKTLTLPPRVSSSLLTRLKTVILEDVPAPRSMGWRCFGWIPINARPHEEREEERETRRGERSRRAVNHTSPPAPAPGRLRRFALRCSIAFDLRHGPTDSDETASQSIKDDGIADHSLNPRIIRPLIGVKHNLAFV